MVTELPGSVPGAQDEAAAGGELLLSWSGLGARASLWQRAVAALDEALPELEKLELLKGDSAPGEVAAIKVLIRSEMMEILGELSLTAGPRITRVEQLFALLLDQLGAMQDGMEDEDNLSRFQVIADATASLYRSWNNVQQIFATQAGIVATLFGLVADATDEVRHSMDAVFLGAEERQSMMIQNLAGMRDTTAISLEELLSWIQNFVTAEGPQALDSAGGFALRNTIAPIARKLRALVLDAVDARNLATFPKRFATPPLQRAMKSLEGRLNELVWNC